MTSETISIQSKPQRAPHYQLQVVDGELLLFSPAHTQILYCNETASLIWELCDGQRSVQDIVDLLAKAFPEAGTTIAPDVQATLHHLHHHGAIVLL